MLERRQFLLAAAGFPVTASVLLSAIASPGAGSGAVAAAPGDDPRFLGWAGPRADRLDHPALKVEGRLPPNLRGVLRRNGPAVHDRHGLRYGHWFEGDGMLQEFRFSGSGVSHRGQVLKTPKLQREDAAGRRLYTVFATPVAGGAPVRRPDDVNVANVSVLDHHGELLALWEGGSASIVARDSLAWKGFKSWGRGLEGLPFTAHPKVEADGTVWAFGYVAGEKPVLLLYHIGPDGRLVKARPVHAAPLGMVHDFVVTRRHLVIVIPPFVHEPGAGTVLDSHVWRPELGSRALVVSKDDFDDRRWAQLPAGFGFHHGNGWEDTGGVIRFDHCVAADPGIVTDSLRDVMRGQLRSAAPERYTRFVLFPDGRARIEEEAGPAEFPRIADRLTGLRNRYVYLLAGAGSPNWLWQSVAKRDLERGTEEGFTFAAGILPEEHVFVPSPDARAEDDGWLVGTVLDYERGVSGITVFDARRIADGPLAYGWLPYPLPLGFHGQFSTA